MSGDNYCKLPDGTLICWGTIQATDGIGSATFPIPFINNTYGVNITPIGTTDNVVQIVSARNITASGLSFAAYSAYRSNGNYYGYASGSFNYTAIGKWK